MAKRKQPEHPEQEPPLFTPAWIHWLRNKKRLTQAQAAKHIGVSQSLWAGWELGTNTPDASRLRLLWVLYGKKLAKFPE